MPTVSANTEKEGTVMPTAAAKKRVRRPARAASTNEEVVTNTDIVEANDASDEENEEGVEEATDEDLDLDDADVEEEPNDPTVVMTVDSFENCNMMDLFKQMCDLEPDVIDGVQLTKVAGDTTLVVQFAHLKLQIVS